MFETLGDMKIGLAGFEIARRVVMGYDNGGGAVFDGRCEDFPGVDETGGEGADGDSAFFDESVGAIDSEEYKVFLFFGADVEEQVEDFVGRVEGLGVDGELAFGKFES